MGATIYPFRTALTLALQAIVQTQALPKINAALTTAFTNASVPSGDQLQFTAEQVRAGDMPVTSEPVICIQRSGLSTLTEVVGAYTYTFSTKITLKLPSVALNLPEHFEGTVAIFEETLLDTFNTLANYFIDPNAILTGLAPPRNAPLPSQNVFQNCYIKGAQDDLPEKLPDGVTVVRRYVAFHTALLLVNANRQES